MPTGDARPVCKCGAGPHASNPEICQKGHAMPGNQRRRIHEAPEPQVPLSGEISERDTVTAQRISRSPKCAAQVWGNGGPGPDERGAVERGEFSASVIPKSITNEPEMWWEE